MLFPGCTVKPWQPVERGLPRRPQEVLDYLVAWAAGAPLGSEIKFSEVYKALDINQDVFRKQVKGHPDLLNALAEHGIEETGTATRKTKYRFNEKPDVLGIVNPR